MKFSQQRLFGYDARLFNPSTLDAMFEHAAEPLGVLVDHYTLSGLIDLREILLIQQEWYNNTNFPILRIKELSRQADGGTQKVHELYNEPINSRLVFSRELDMHTHVTYGDPDIKHSKRGQEIEQNITAFFGLQNLADTDYFPDVGDHLVFLGRIFEIARVFYKPDDTFQNSGVPMHVTVVATIFQFGDRRPPVEQGKVPPASPHPGDL